MRPKPRGKPTLRYVPGLGEGWDAMAGVEVCYGPVRLLDPWFPSSSLSFFGRTPVGEYCDLSGHGEKRDEDENPLQMLMGMEPPVSEPVECWDLVEAGKDRIEVIGKGLDSDQIVSMGNKAGGELSWEKSDWPSLVNFWGFQQKV
ncbi:hypothetical protein CK203_004078 [Vitis vinifera]|uniref:Uncharacterized protein n=1 Tax=Vitis vinifera TaxID=29760 RepID=A0A438K9C0_VITVI|nr:hypothetical protein CK203_004078 [Vitis vinifera]